MKAAWQFWASVLVVTAGAGRAIAGCSSDSDGTGAADGSSEAPGADGVAQPEAGATTRRDANADAPSDADASADSLADSEAGDAGLDSDTSIDSPEDTTTGPGDAGLDSDTSTDSPDDTSTGPDDAGPEADSEPADDAGSDCGTATQCLIGSEGGPGCLTCTESQCPDPSLYCESFGLQTAAAGPAAGRLRKDLCLATLSCIFTSQCYFGTGVDACYCGFSESTLQCSMTGPGPDAPCVTEEQDGLETTDPGTLLGRLTDLTFGAGAANALFLCLEMCPDCP